MQILPLDQWRHLLDRLSVQMVERKTSGHMTADHWQYAFAGFVTFIRFTFRAREILRQFWPDETPFTFVSDEFNGHNKDVRADVLGRPRPTVSAGLAKGQCGIVADMTAKILKDV